MDVNRSITSNMIYKIINQAINFPSNFALEKGKKIPPFFKRKNAIIIFQRKY